MPAWTMACSRFCPSRTRPSASSLMASPVSRHSPRWMAAVMASMRRRVILRLVPPRSSHSWASSGVMVTISSWSGASRPAAGGFFLVPSAAVRLPDGDGRAPTGLCVVATPCSFRSELGAFVLQSAWRAWQWLLDCADWCSALPWRGRWPRPATGPRADVRGAGGASQPRASGADHGQSRSCRISDPRLTRASRRAGLVVNRFSKEGNAVRLSTGPLVHHQVLRVHRHRAPLSGESRTGHQPLEPLSNQEAQHLLARLVAGLVEGLV